MRLVAPLLVLVACGGTPQHPHDDDSSDDSGPFVDAKGFKPRSFVDHVTGKGRPVIFIPGLGCPGEMWDDTVEYLGGHIQAHVLTLSGFAGRKAVKPPLAATVRKELIRYIRSNKLKDPIIVGHSLGGFIAYWLAATAPDLIGGVIVVDAGPALAATDAETGHDLRNMWAQAGDDELEPQIRTAYTSMTVDPKHMEPYIEAIARSDRQAMGDAIYELVKTDLRDQVHAITAPFLLVLADGGYQQIYRKMVEPIEHREVVVIPKTRHFVMFDDPEAFDAVLLKFIVAHTVSRAD